MTTWKSPFAELDAVMSAGWKSVPDEVILEMCGLMIDEQGALVKREQAAATDRSEPDRIL